MSILATFLAGAALALVLSISTVLVLRPSLAELLLEVCGSVARARFWVVAATLSLFLVGLLAGTDGGDYPRGGEPGQTALFLALVAQVRTCLIGLLAGLATVSCVLLYWVAAAERAARSRVIEADMAR